MGWAPRIIATLSVLLLFGCGSYQPKIGDSPFLCVDTGEESCPAEYHCIEGICRPEGWEPPPDGGVDGDVDGGVDDAVATDTSEQADGSPSDGDMADLSGQDGGG